MKSFYLFINTVNQNRPSFAVFDGGGHILYSYKFIGKQEDLVKELGNFFKKAKSRTEGRGTVYSRLKQRPSGAGEKMRPAEIKAILVVSGPGSFSASRAGIVLANSFNFLNKMPVLSVKDEGCSTEELIKNNLNGLKRSKKTATGEVYYQKEPDITIRQLS